MRILLSLSFLVVANICFAQIEREHCRVEIFLLKPAAAAVDPPTHLVAIYSANKDDLADTAFIKDAEIRSFCIIRDTIEGSQGRVMKERYRFIVDTSVAGRVKQLNIPLCCGKKFALVADSEIISAGYIWNFYSSFGSDWITAFSYGSYFEVERKLPDYGGQSDADAFVRDPRLLDCLRRTGRLCGGIK